MRSMPAPVRLTDRRFRRSATRQGKTRRGIVGRRVSGKDDDVAEEQAAGERQRGGEHGRGARMRATDGRDRLQYNRRQDPDPDHAIVMDLSQSAAFDRPGNHRSRVPAHGEEQSKLGESGNPAEALQPVQGPLARAAAKRKYEGDRG